MLDGAEYDWLSVEPDDWDRMSADLEPEQVLVCSVLRQAYRDAIGMAIIEDDEYGKKEASTSAKAWWKHSDTMLWYCGLIGIDGKLLRGRIE